jgi:hypothetical protein
VSSTFQSGLSRLVLCVHRASGRSGAKRARARYIVADHGKPGWRAPGFRRYTNPSCHCQARLHEGGMPPERVDMDGLPELVEVQQERREET